MESLLCWPSASGQSLLWSVIDTLSDTLLEQTDFLFPTKYQLQVVSWLRICVPYAFLVLGFCLL